MLRRIAEEEKRREGVIRVGYGKIGWTIRGDFEMKRKKC